MLFSSYYFSYTPNQDNCYDLPSVKTFQKMKCRLNRLFLRSLPNDKKQTDQQSPKAYHCELIE